MLKLMQHYCAISFQSWIILALFQENCYERGNKNILYYDYSVFNAFFVCVYFPFIMEYPYTIEVDFLWLNQSKHNVGTREEINTQS